MKVTRGHVHNDWGKSSAPRLLMTALLRETLILEKKTFIEKAYLRFGFGYFPYGMQANYWIVSHDQCWITACKHHTYSCVTNVAYFALNFTCDWPWFIQRMHDTEYCGNIPVVNNYYSYLLAVISIPLINLGSSIFLAGSPQWHVAPISVWVL